MMNTTIEKETTVKNAVILISDPLSEEGLQPLREAEGVELKIQTGMTPEELLHAVKDADALLVRSQTQVTREVIEAAGSRTTDGGQG